MDCDHIELPPAKYANMPVPPHVVRYVSQHELRQLSGIRGVEICGWTDPNNKVIYVDVSQKGRNNTRLFLHEEGHLKGWRHPIAGLAELLTKF